VALFGWVTYMVKIVENWWCPFGHEKKETYADGAIDKSLWHLDDSTAEKLHPEDRDNPIWNEDAGRKE